MSPGQSGHAIRQSPIGTMDRDRRGDTAYHISIVNDLVIQQRIQSQAIRQRIEVHHLGTVVNQLSSIVNLLAVDVHLGLVAGDHPSASVDEKGQ